jgi:hypothetical protein
LPEIRVAVMIDEAISTLHKTDANSVTATFGSYRFSPSHNPYLVLHPIAGDE